MSENTDSKIEEKVSENAKKVLIALFMLVGGIVGTYAAVLLTRGELTEGLGATFSGAITGSFAVAGTLIQSLWGK